MTAREFTDIYIPLSDVLYRVAFRLMESQEDAEDAIQDLYLKLWADREKLDTVYNPEAYCISALRNICIDRLRREKVQKTELEDVQSRIDDHGRNLEQRESLEGVTRLIAKLSPSQRALLRMKIFEGLSYDEMAERTGMSKLTMRVLLSQARSKLKHIIAAASVTVAVVAALLITLGTERNPADTFDDPEQAYAELNRSFSYIASKINEGIEISTNAEETIIKNLEILNR